MMAPPWLCVLTSNGGPAAGEVLDRGLMPVAPVH